MGKRQISKKKSRSRQTKVVKSVRQDLPIDPKTIVSCITEPESIQETELFEDLGGLQIDDTKPIAQLPAPVSANAHSSKSPEATDIGSPQNASSNCAFGGDNRNIPAAPVLPYTYAPEEFKAQFEAGEGIRDNDEEQAGNNHEKESNNRDKSNSKIYEIKASAGKGHGVFAIRDVKCGTRILSEIPLFSVERMYSLASLKIAFTELSLDQQQRFLELHSSRDPGKDPLMAIFELNCLPVGDYAGVCLEVSRINHSCVPNAYFAWNANVGRITVHAIVDISAGEEVTICYVPAFLDAHHRQQLTRRYGFICDCQACDTTTSFGRASDIRRKKMFELDQTLGFCGPFSSSSVRKLRSAATELISLLKDEGLVNIELSRAHHDAARLFSLEGMVRLALDHAQMELGVDMYCHGPDSPLVKDTMSFIADLKIHDRHDYSALSNL